MGIFHTDVVYRTLHCCANIFALLYLQRDISILYLDINGWYKNRYNPAHCIPQNDIYIRRCTMIHLENYNINSWFQNWFEKLFCHGLLLRIWFLLLNYYNIVSIRIESSLNIILMCGLWLKVKICANQNMNTICDWPHHHHALLLLVFYLNNNDRHHVRILYDEWMQISYDYDYHLFFYGLIVSVVSQPFSKM